jgi:pimeloyl-ACP methyl ester carboxylesterase
LELAAQFRVLVPDLPGFGSSSLPPPNIGIQDYAAEVTRTLRQLIPSGASIRIAGFSFGCRVAGQLAAAWPGAVERLFLIAPGGLPLPRPSVPMLRRAGTEADDVEHLNAHRYNLRAIMFADPAMADDLAVTIQTRNVAEAKYRIKMLRDDESLHRAISTLDIRIIGIWGAADRYSTGLMDTRIHYMRHEIRSGAAFIIPNAGHWVMHEKAQETNSLLSN